MELILVAVAKWAEDRALNPLNTIASPTARADYLALAKMCRRIAIYL